jgi:acetylornithine deacetylase/succinyl-diaminopimelate desuccinylase-like protein
MVVEHDTNACLWKHFVREEPLPDGICNDLKDSIDAVATVSDHEAFKASKELLAAGITTGLAGSFGLAALYQLSEENRARLSMTVDSTVILICKSGTAPTSTPHDVSIDDVIELTQKLVQIDSSNPDFGFPPGPGEIEIARYVTAWLAHRDVETHWLETHPGRPSVVGVARGIGGGKSLMFNGHLDTVTTVGYRGNPLGGEIMDKNIYGRGTADMKSGLACAMIATAAARTQKLSGDVILAAVADEESESKGTEEILAAGWRADAVLVGEPTEMALINTHKGFCLFEVDIHGVSAHGSRPDLGIDAICKAGYFLTELDRHAQELLTRTSEATKDTGPPNIHCGVVKGGLEVASYPALCTIFIERRTVAGETAETAGAELVVILQRLSQTVPDFKYEFRSTFERLPYFIARDDPFVQLVAKHTAKATGTVAIVKGETYWTDLALLGEAGIPGLILGPKGYGLHAQTEWAEVQSVKELLTTFLSVVEDFCA